MNIKKCLKGLALIVLTGAAQANTLPEDSISEGSVPGTSTPDISALSGSRHSDIRQNNTPHLTAEADQWKYAVTLYGYLPSVHGQVSFPNRPLNPSFTVSQQEILSNLNLAFMGTVRAHKGDWGVLADVFHANLSDSAKVTRDVKVRGIPIKGASANLDLDSRTTLLTLAGTYALTDTPRNVTRLVAGARMLDTQQKLDWKLSGTVPGLGTLEHDGRSKINRTVWDGIVGVTGQARFGDGLRWFAPYHLDVGAGDSKLTGQALVGVGYSYPWGGLTATWRYIGYDFKSGEAISSLSFNGPAVGVVLHF